MKMEIFGDVSYLNDRSTLFGLHGRTRTLAMITPLQQPDCRHTKFVLRHTPQPRHHDYVCPLMAACNTSQAPTTSLLGRPGSREKQRPNILHMIDSEEGFQSIYL